MDGTSGLFTLSGLELLHYYIPYVNDLINIKPPIRVNGGLVIFENMLNNMLLEMNKYSVNCLYNTIFEKNEWSK